MRREDVNIEKYTIERAGKTYFIYLIPTDDAIEFVLNREGFDSYRYVVGLLESERDEFEDVIERNIDLWIEDYEMLLEE